MSHMANKALELYCINCTVRKQCQDYRKRTNSDEGVWGGKLQTRGNGKKE